MQRGVGGGGAPEVVQRVLVAQDLLDCARQQRRIGAHLGELLGVLEQREDARRQHRLGGVVARGDQLHEEDAEVEVAHRAVAEVAGEDQRREVVAGLLGAALRGELHRVDRHVHGAVATRLVRRALGGARALRADDVGVLAAGVHLGPVLDLVPVVPGQPHQLTHHLARQQRGDVVHEVDVDPLARLRVDLLADGADPALEAAR